ncbi:MAG: hypothetical protein ABFS46_17650 [Myxococcota bacterium]
MKGYIPGSLGRCNLGDSLADPLLRFRLLFFGAFHLDFRGYFSLLFRSRHLSFSRCLCTLFFFHGSSFLALFLLSTLANGFGLDWGRSLTAGKRTDSTATNGASYDYGVGIGQTLFGAQAYLQVFAFTGTSVTVTVEDSPDDSIWTALAAFTAVTAAPASERIETTRTETVDRYLRVATTGTFSNAVFLVTVSKNETDYPL